MALPKMAVPMYSVVLPSTGQELQMRPYLVKEEKILMIALESNDPQQISTAVRNIIVSCIEDIIDMDELTVFDIEKLFLELRSISVGETVELSIKCSECEENNTAAVNLKEVNLSEYVQGANIIQLDTSIGIELKYPTVNDISDISAGKLESVEGMMELITNCIVNIFDADNVYSAKDEKKEFIDGLNSAQFKKIQAFFESTPMLVHNIEFKCSKCEHENSIELKGLNSFFG
jgi:ribosomal protein L44E